LCQSDRQTEIIHFERNPLGLRTLYDNHINLVIGKITGLVNVKLRSSELHRHGGNYEFSLIQCGRFATVSESFVRMTSFYDYQQYDWPDGDLHMDYNFWVIRAGDQVILMDTATTSPLTTGSARSA